MAKVKVAVLGVGSLGKHHARLYAELAATGAVDFAGIYDASAATAQKISARHGLKIFASIAEAAVREMREEAGLTGSVIEALGTISYKFWAQSEQSRVSKSVEFFLMLYRAGSPAKFSPDEVENVKLVPIEQAEHLHAALKQAGVRAVTAAQVLA